ncbi:helix-turn-helix domain-containing protein [Shimwellia pseudoproteus]|uniref:helix-turn-helix domain-containing protein n=1 Tax=Shimwellia pseudoproteus TaxID=570012 RepID=UPI0018EA7BE2|nr:helix-turn-helix domain-containing protein [Shimwellia pseudoproteus]MBJ3813636.1 helix-turn-helix domain-containing protein [Shimwellia pseudoproteus]
MDIPAQVIEDLLVWIDNNLDKPLRIDDIARYAGYSKWHLQRMFLNHTGHNLARYIRERKLRLAARDLCTTTETVYQICSRYGFESQQSFTRIFTKTFHLPPGMYRKSPGSLPPQPGHAA